MKIKNVKINSYGKLNNREIEFNDKINLIYGKNESGKSTLLRFIENCFYGISKNKKGKEFSDYDNYLPWKGEEFSGKIDLEELAKNKNLKGLFVKEILEELNKNNYDKKLLENVLEIGLNIINKK